MKTTMRLAVLAFVFGVVASSSHAATITVAAGEVLLLPNNQKCSLREAILNAETGTDVSALDCTAGTAGADTIVLAAGSTYSLPDRDPYPLEVLLNDREFNGLPEMHTKLTIEGNGATIARSSGDCFRILYVSPLGDITLNNMTLQNGCAQYTCPAPDAAMTCGAGGAIFNRGTLTLDTVTLASNFALRSGGGLHNDGTLTVSRSTVRNNSTSAGAGGGIVNRGAMQVFQSTISSNSTPGAGGALDAGVVPAGGLGAGSGKATIANSTLSSNLSVGNGGGMFFSTAQSAKVVNSTILSNFSYGLGGGGIWVNYGGSVTLSNSLVGPQNNSTNCWYLGFGLLIGEGTNLGTDGTCPSSISANPLVGPLANNSGPTQTHALLFGSPAIGAADNAIASAFPVSGVDQRGMTRPQGASSDIGAFEFVPAGTTVSVVTSGSPSTFGGSVTFTATVSAGTGTVAFYDGATLLGTQPISGTTAAFTTSALSVGSHTITAVYSGDANYETSTSAAITQTVNPIPTTTVVATSGTPSTYGSSVTFTATVTIGATGSVAFYDGATPLGVGVLTGTTASITTSALTAGAHSITASYQGDTNYAPSTSAPITQTVDPATGGVTLGSSLNPSTFGDAVTFTATVASDATGTITFSDGATPLGTSTISSGSATFTTSALTGGSHAMTAAYPGDLNHSAATSAILTQVVNRLSPTTAFSSGGGTYLPGGAVTLTVTVTSGATGTVTFSEGTTILGSAPLINGTASFTTTTLPPGAHTITASYNGDTNYAPSSAVLAAIQVNSGLNVPTLSTWMLLGLAMALALGAVAKIIR